VQSTTDWSLSPHPPPSPPHQSFTEEETADAREAAASSTRVTPSATTTTHRLSIHCNQDVWLQVYILDSGYGVVEDLSMDGNNGLALKGHEVVRRIPADYGAHVRVGAPELPPFDAVTIGLDGSPVTIRKQVSLNAWECKFHVADVIE
jgi:hypothetical protein